MALHKYLRAGKLGVLRAGFLTAAALVAVPAASHAQLISYTFTPGASATFAAGTSVFSGGFTFNTVTRAVTNANIVLTGPAFAGVYTNPQPPQLDGTDILVLNPLNNNNLFIRFLNPLGDAPNTFSTINVSIPNVGPQVALAVSGGVAGSVVPEPGTWALLGTGLLGVAGIARRKRTA